MFAVKDHIREVLGTATNGQVAIRVISAWSSYWNEVVHLQWRFFYLHWSACGVLDSQVERP